MAATKRPEDVASVDVYTAKGLLSVGHRYLDVRTVEEFNKSHVENALNIPYMFITEEGIMVATVEADHLKLVLIFSMKVSSM
ncbi:hypothetical protein GBA52_011052 [Prunus armeniaca]|nr:hypothetical protein GBA52_011052 [Prunus armeniaca]